MRARERAPRRAAVLAAVLAAAAVMSSAGARAIVVTCANCSETWTQSLERITNLEDLRTTLAQYQEAVAQTQQQIALVQNNIKQYENMLLNTRTLPQEMAALLRTVLGTLARETVRINTLKGDYVALGQVFDELYPGLDLIRGIAGGGGGLSADELWERMTRESDRATEATFKLSGMQLQDLASSEAGLERHIDQLLSTPEGQMEALSAGNQLAAVQISEARRLRELLAAGVQASAQAAAAELKEEQMSAERWKSFMAPGSLWSDQ